MEQSLIKKTSAALGFVMLTSICAPAAAGFVDDFFDDVWVQTTDARIFNTQKRGGLIGGSVSVRIPNKSISVVNFTPPSFEAGCGGVDLNFGAFGFIDGQELIELLKRIGQQAKALLFQIAVETLNQMLGGLMKEFAAKVQAMNDLLRNSCDIAQAGANAFAGMLGDEDRATAANTFWDTSIKKAEGIFTDWDGVKNAYKEGKDVFRNKKSDGSDATEQNDKNPAFGNLTWRALVIGDAITYMQFGAAKAGSSDYNKGLAMTLLANVVGTSITPNMDLEAEDACKSERADSGTADGTPTAGDAPTSGAAGCKAAVTIITPRITSVMDLVNPSENLIAVCMEDGAPTDPNSADWNAYIYQLGVGTPKACKTMKENSVRLSVVFAGTKAMVNKLLFGISKAELTTAEKAAPVDGIVGYLTGKKATLSNDEIKILGNLEMPILALLRKVQRKPQAVISLADMLAEPMAVREALRMSKSFEIAASNVFVSANSKINIPLKFDSNLQAWRNSVAIYELEYGGKKMAEFMNQVVLTTDNVYRSFDVSAAGITR